MKTRVVLALGAVLAFGGLGGAFAQAPLSRTDIHVPVKSIAPGMNGAQADIYVREVRGASASKGVVLFVHGAGTPAEVSFDAPGASWMGYLAAAGFDTFSMDMEGYGRSTRPPPMNDPCNAPAATRAQLTPPPTCSGSAYSGPITHIGSDWNDIAAVVDHLLKLRQVKTVSIVAWSQGGPRSFGYTLAHPDKVARLAVLAPAYNRNMPDAMAPVAATFTPFGTQNKAEFVANWERQAPCAGQADPAIRDAIWEDMLKSDPVGAKWGPGMRRAPSVPSWGFNKTTVAKMTTPYLMITGATDGQVPPARVFELYEDLGSKDKVLIDLACSSHNAMWEKNRELLYKASLDWLSTGKVAGTSSGMLKMGY
jgi:pimeloyl-ACP methyl ester carboxylesterase